MAAPFCLTILGMQPQCIYTDPNLCQREAAKQGGSCEPDAGPSFRTVGSARYCLSTAPGTGQCGYLTFEQCNEEARRQKGACYYDGSKVGAPNPYNYSNGP
jgi:hypothetical protein